MRIAVIGLGDFAEKAYLPGLAQRADIELHLVTRNKRRLTELGERYGVISRHEDWRQAVDVGVDAALVHVATHAHVPVVEGLLRAGVHVYVDKPLADSYAAARGLVELADSVSRSLAVGFNRRWAPAYLALRDVSRHVVTMEKSRAHLSENLREFVFVDFIHVVDTLRFLAPSPVLQHDVRVTLRDGVPWQVSLQMSGADFFALGTTHRVDSGFSEVVECIGSDGAQYRVTDLDTTVVNRGSARQVLKRAMWSRTPWQRGIEGMVDDFLHSVRSGVIVSAHDALVTHRWCEEIIESVVEAGVDITGSGSHRSAGE